MEDSDGIVDFPIICEYVAQYNSNSDRIDDFSSFFKPNWIKKLKERSNEYSSFVNRVRHDRIDNYLYFDVDETVALFEGDRASALLFCNSPLLLCAYLNKIWSDRRENVYRTKETFRRDIELQKKILQHLSESIPDNVVNFLTDPTRRDVLAPQEMVDFFINERNGKIDPTEDNSSRKLLQLRWPPLITFLAKRGIKTNDEMKTSFETTRQSNNAKQCVNVNDASGEGSGPDLYPNHLFSGLALHLDLLDDKTKLLPCFAQKNHYSSQESYYDWVWSSLSPLETMLVEYARDLVANVPSAPPMSAPSSLKRKRKRSLKRIDATNTTTNVDSVDAVSKESIVNPKNLAVAGIAIMMIGVFMIYSNGRKKR